MITHEHEVNKQNNFIMGFYDRDNPLLDKIIEHYENSPDKFDGTTWRKGIVVDKTVKDSVDLILDNQLLYDYQNIILQPALDKFLEKYEWANKCYKFNVFEYTNIQKYPPNGGYFSWHTERMNPASMRRHLVFMTYLNDVEEGGETEFYYQGVKIKPERGLTLIWCSDWTHIHRGIPAPNESKMIVTGWYSYNMDEWYGTDCPDRQYIDGTW